MMTFDQEMEEVSKGMSPEQYDAFLNHIDVVDNDVDVQHMENWSDHPEIWRFPMVSFDTFIDSERYLGVGHVIYPEIRQMAREILEGGYSEAVIVAGIGSGKTTTAELIACYLVHKLLCMRDPFKFYQLAKDKPIAFINMGTTSTQALEVGFKGIKKFMTDSPWFMGFNPHMTESMMRFRQSNILLLSGNSKSSTPLGYNVYYGFLDEAAFYMDNDQKNVAEDIYNGLQRRITSRFGHDGMAVMTSSPNYENDFVMTKLEEAQRAPDKVYAMQLPTWKCKPLSKADMAGKFYFDARKERIVDIKDIAKESTNFVDEPGFDYEKDYWEIPGEYKKSFIQNPQKAKRDFAALPGKTISGFLPQTDLVKAMFTGQENPLQPSGEYKFPDRPLRLEYFVHVDLAKNKNGKGDFGGLAMAHFDGWEKNEATGEKEARVVVDLAERLKAGKTGEIEFADVREKLYKLRAMGFNIKIVTFDQFQSVDSQQILRRKGIRSELLSVDRTTDPYDTFKALIYTQRVKCHASPELEGELIRLEEKNGKIDHPPTGSKDVADATCGAIFNVMTRASKSELGVTNLAKPNTMRTPEDKTAYYTRLEDWHRRGII